jgi:N-acetylmuramic acid 6-phosphate etherase
MSTEAVDPRYEDIDRWPTAVAVRAMIEGQMAAVAATLGQVTALSAAADAAAERLKAGGRIVYAGAGTSGRIAVQDGVELTPTFNWPEERLVFVLAGGLPSLIKGIEGAEDDTDDARAQIAAADVSARDVLVGVAASGRTPFTVAALAAGRACGALTIGIANNDGTPVLRAAEHAIFADTGSEAIAGSTRMKAGTAQKVLLNILSTAMMLRCGLVHRGLMVNMRVANDKLRHRAEAMVASISGASPAAAKTALGEAEDDIKLAVLLATGWTRADAERALSANGNNLRDVLGIGG